MPRRKQTVVTIHGVNTDGAWQEIVAEVLQPHFNCVTVKYDDFNNLFKTIDVALDKWLFLIGGLVFLATLFGFLHVLFGFFCCLVIFVIAALVSRWHRRKTLERIKSTLDGACRTGETPHVIAHSFGSYLAGSSLLFPDISYNRIVLVGAVLPLPPRRSI